MKLKVKESTKTKFKISTKNIKSVNNKLNSKKYNKCKIDDEDSDKDIENNTKNDNNDEIDEIKYND